MDNQYSSSNMYSEAQNCWQQQQSGTSWPYPVAGGNQSLTKSPGDDIMSIVMGRRLGGQAPPPTGTMDTGFTAPPPTGSMDTGFTAPPPTGTMDTGFTSSMDSVATGNMEHSFRNGMDNVPTGNVDNGYRNSMDNVPTSNMDNGFRSGGQAPPSLGSIEPGFASSVDSVSTGNMENGFRNGMDNVPTGNIDNGYRNSMGTTPTGSMNNGFGSGMENVPTSNMDNGFRSNMNTGPSGNMDNSFRNGNGTAPADSMNTDFGSSLDTVHTGNIETGFNTTGNDMYNTTYGNYSNSSGNATNVSANGASVMGGGLDSQMSAELSIPNNMGDGYSTGQNDSYNGHYANCSTSAGNTAASAGYQGNTNCSTSVENTAAGDQGGNGGMFDHAVANLDTYRNENNEHYNGNYISGCSNNADSSSVGYANSNTGMYTNNNVSQTSSNVFYDGRQVQGNVDWNKSQDECDPPASKRRKTEDLTEHRYDELDGFPSCSGDSKKQEKDNILTVIKDMPPDVKLDDKSQTVIKQVPVDVDAGENIKVEVSADCLPTSLGNSTFGISGFESLNSSNNFDERGDSVPENDVKNTCGFSPLSDPDPKENAGTSECQSAPQTLTETVPDKSEILKESEESLHDEIKCDADKTDDARSDDTSVNDRSDLDAKEHSFLDLFKRSDSKSSSGHDKLEDMFLKRHEKRIKLRDRSEGSIDSLGETDDNSGLGASTDRSMTQSPLVSDSADGKDSKKSRKQNAPKRLVKGPGDGVIKSMNEEENVNNQSQESEQKNKPEKSRKQFKPQRIVHAFDDNQDEIDPAVESKEVLEDTQPDNEGEEEEEEDYYSCLEKDQERSQSLPHKIPPHLAALYQYGSPLSYPAKESSGASPYLGLAGTKLSPSSWQSKLLADFRNNVIKSQSSSPDLAPAAQNDDLKENIEVVRKLREIRFNRYRKITIAEKKEIAAYAKVNSVSAAANRYSVSKSAVSMWTRMDFSNISDDSEKKKKYSVLENERFEELVHRVKEERAHKFKGLSREEKAEVSKYAKLVGVREMSRCLDIALGTVSGWMRQFPYKPSKQDEDSKEGNGNSTNSQADADHTDEALKANDDSRNDQGSSSKQMTEVNKSKDSNLTEHVTQNASEDSAKEAGDSSLRRSTRSRTNFAIDNCDIKIKTEPEEVPEASEGTSSKHYKKNEVDESSNDTNDGYFTPEVRLKLKQENNGTTHDKCDLNVSKCQSNKTETSKADSGDKSADSQKVKTETDEVKNKKLDAMLADTMKEPDIQQCYADIKEMIAGTPLDGDTFFEELFGRVVKARADKYKSLKASDKLEVVRYAKRNGVRRIAKVMGLATGTLSGWNLRYQAHLGLTADHFTSVRNESFQGTDSLNTSTASNSGSCPETESTPGLSESFGNTEVSNTQSPSMMSKTPKKQSSSVLDNIEKSEVIAIKLLLKDRYQFLLDKIDIARKIKFRNVSPYEKIEIVKCAKLVGIRPTARVLKMPIGTLSGWIAKYANELHPAYHSEGQEGPETPSLPAIPGMAGDLSKFGSPLGTPVRAGMMPSWLGLMSSFNASLMNAAATMALGGPSALQQLGMVSVDSSRSESMDINELDDKVRVLNYNKDFGAELDSGNGLNNEGSSSTVSTQKDGVQVEPGLDESADNTQENVDADVQGGSDGAEGVPEDADEDTKAMVQKYLQSAYAHLGMS